MRKDNIMSKGYEAKDYNITETGVRFRIADGALQRVFERCEALAKENIKIFGDRKVMQEGAKYQGVWLETQPMGGEMYATRDMEVALNNHLIFMQYQRRDGRMAGMITYREPFQGMAVHQDWMQGDFFTVSALRMYWFLGEDKAYLQRLYECLRDFDEYLWNYRDSDGDGCLEAWCTWDTGDDNCTKLLYQGVHAHEHGLHCGEHAPEDHGGMPFESAEYMAYSYSHRAVLAEISDILGNGEGDKWRAAAKEVQDKVRDYLWDEKIGAAFDRDRNNEIMPVLTMSNMKCLYHGLFTQEMADEFIRRHLLNPDEFFTKVPLPSIAANDPLFYAGEDCNNLSPEALAQVKKFMAGDIADNSWSGPVGGLTAQRASTALLRYGHHAEASVIGRRWIDNLAAQDRYVQMYHPHTGAAAPGTEGYGPTILAALEYFTYLFGIDYVNGKLIWSCSAEGADSVYEQKLFGRTYTLERKEKWAILRVDGKVKAEASLGARIVTDLDGEVETVAGMEAAPVSYMLWHHFKQSRAVLHPNEVMRWENDALVHDAQVECAL
ncbi:MAG: hypothetical protein J6C52_08290 [Clostridia bacterium]|nr:hypothetical protein [Clostridia bacterium]